MYRFICLYKQLLSADVATELLRCPGFDNRLRYLLDRSQLICWDWHRFDYASICPSLLPFPAFLYLFTWAVHTAMDIFSDGPNVKNMQMFRIYN